jgi:hypothetical protein
MVGERQVVLDYLALCRSFWPAGEARLDQWRARIERGEAPPLATGAEE